METLSLGRRKFLLMQCLLACSALFCRGQNSTSAPAAVPTMENSTMRPSVKNPSYLSPSTISPAQTPVQVNVTSSPVPVPTTQAPITANVSAAPSMSPLPVNVSNPPSQAPTTRVPTPPPTNLPTFIVTTLAPSSVPSTVPSNTPTANQTTIAPTASPTTEPTLEPTNLPTKRPTKQPSKQPTKKPTKQPTNSPSSPAPISGTDRSATVSIIAEYKNVGSVSENDVIKMLEDTETWFENSFNNKSFTDRLLLRNCRHRRVQEQPGNPSDSGISNMATEISLVRSEVISDGIRVIYDQDMQWRESMSDFTTNEIALLPYNYEPTNQLYVDILNNINGFENLASPFPIPEIPSAPTSAPTQSQPSESSSPLSLGAIIGIAVGGLVVLLIVLYCLYAACCKASGGPESDRDSRMSSVEYRSGTGYSAPPYRAASSRDEISSNDFLREPRGSVNYDQDQSVATVDYDYSKAYGGGGDTSVVSSSGGTMGDTTRQSASDVAAIAAKRAALGASFDSDGGRAAMGAGVGFGETNNENMKEEIIEIDAPAGKLGVVIDTPDDGAPVVHAVKDSSVIANQICVGDKLIAVDDEDVRSMTAIKVSKLISRKAANSSRKLTVVRTSYVDDGE